MFIYRDQDTTEIEDDIDCVTGHKKVQITFILNLFLFLKKKIVLEIKMDESY